MKKGGAAPGATARPSRELKGVSYDVYVEGKGWVQAENGAEAGTTGEGKRMEALRMYVGDGTYTGSIQYQTYVQTYGWRNLATAGNVSGAENSGKRMEALKINLTGELAKHYECIAGACTDHWLVGLGEKWGSRRNLWTEQAY